MTPTIFIGNSMSQVKDISVKMEKDLRLLLSYTSDPQTSYFSGRYANTRKYLIDKKGQFPTGLLYVVEDYLETMEIEHYKVDSRVRPAQSKNLFHINLEYKPYIDQETAVHNACAADRGTISMPTGTGKSITMALLISALQVRTLIVVPNLGLKKQLSEDFKRYFGKLDNITIENIDSPALATASNYDCLIIDEAHHVAAKTYRKLNSKVWTGIYYRFFFTATPFRSRNEEQLLMESIAGEIIFNLSYRDAVTNGYIVPVKAYYYELPKKVVNGRSWPEVYSELIVNNKYRNDIIAKELDSFRDKGLSVLCLVKEINHGMNIGKASEYTHAFIKGENEDNRERLLEFNLNHRTTLIGTTGVLGEGVDTKPAEFIIIAGLGKSKPAFMQAVGRGIRRYKNKASCKIMIFKDSSHKWTLAHFKAQVKYLREEYGVVPSKIDITKESE